MLKGRRSLLLMGQKKVPEDKPHKLQEALRFNQEALRFNEPLSTASYLKEKLRLLWSRRTADSMRRFPGALERPRLGQRHHPEDQPGQNLAPPRHRHPQRLPPPDQQRQTRKASTTSSAP